MLKEIVEENVLNLYVRRQKYLDNGRKLAISCGGRRHCGVELNTLLIHGIESRVLLNEPRCSLGRECM